MDADLRIFRTASDPSLQEEAVSLGIGYPALPLSAWMFGREHEKRDWSKLRFQHGVPFVTRRAVALPAQRRRRALASTQTLGDHVLPAARLTNESRLTKDAISHTYAPG